MSPPSHAPLKVKGPSDDEQVLGPYNWSHGDKRLVANILSSSPTF